MEVYEGNLSNSEKRIAIIASRFNQIATDSLVKAANATFLKQGGHQDNIAVYWVPGAFEIAGVLTRLVASNQWDAVVCLGAIIRGGTSHFDFLCSATMSLLAKMASEIAIPISLGILTTDTTEQAMERAGGKLGNKGSECILASLEMLSLYEKMNK